jgi:hypothetical protein
MMFINVAEVPLLALRSHLDAPDRGQAEAVPQLQAAAVGHARSGQSIPHGPETEGEGLSR